MGTQIFTIHEPIWKDMSVGLKKTDIKLHNTVYIKYKYKQGMKKGQRMFPYPYHVGKETVLKCPTKTVRNGVKLYIVPMSKMSMMPDYEEVKDAAKNIK